MNNRILMTYAAVGAITGLVVGYAIYAVGKGQHHVPFVTWATETREFYGGRPQDALLFLGLGGLAGFIVAYIRAQKNSN